MSLFRKALFCIVLLFFALLHQGCVTLYKPNLVYSPVLKQKGDGAVGGEVGLSGSGMLGAHGAYALTNHIGLTGELMYHNRTIKSETDKERIDISHFQAGAGYFFTFGDMGKAEFQIYGGAGRGKSHDRIYSEDGLSPDARAQFTNVYLQPGIAMYNENIELAFDVRANYVRMDHLNATLIDEFDWWNTDYLYAANWSLDFINLEPAVTFRFGGQNLKGMMQLGAIIPTVNPENYFLVNSSIVFLTPLVKLGMGMSYQFNTRKKSETHIVD